jgi:hypothetical protein
LSMRARAHFGTVLMMCVSVAVRCYLAGSVALRGSVAMRGPVSVAAVAVASVTVT